MDQGVRSPIASQGAVRATSHAMDAMGFQWVTCCHLGGDGKTSGFSLDGRSGPRPREHLRDPASDVVALCGTFVILCPVAKQVARPAHRSKSQVLETQQRLICKNSACQSAWPIQGGSARARAPTGRGYPPAAQTQ